MQANGSINLNNDFTGVFIGIGSSTNFTSTGSYNVNLPFINTATMFNAGVPSANWVISGYYSTNDEEILQLQVSVKVVSGITVYLAINNLNAELVDYLPPIQV